MGRHHNFSILTQKRRGPRGPQRGRPARGPGVQRPVAPYLLSESWCSTPRERRTHPTLVPRPSPDLDSSDHSPPPASGRRPTPLRLPGISPPQATSSVPHGLAAGHLQGSFLSFSSFPPSPPNIPVLRFSRFVLEVQGLDWIGWMRPSWDRTRGTTSMGRQPCEIAHLPSRN